MKLPSVTGSSTPDQRSPDNNNNNESNNVNHDIIVIIGEQAVKSTSGAHCPSGYAEGELGPSSQKMLKPNPNGYCSQQGAGSVAGFQSHRHCVPQGSCAMGKHLSKITGPLDLGRARAVRKCPRSQQYQ